MAAMSIETLDLHQGGGHCLIEQFLETMKANRRLTHSSLLQMLHIKQGGGYMNILFINKYICVLNCYNNFLENKAFFII